MKSIKMSAISIVVLSLILGDSVAVGYEIVEWGTNIFHEVNCPQGNDYMAITAGLWHNLAIKADGSTIGWGDDSNNKIDCPPGNDYVAIAAGSYHSLALKADGSIVAWGRDDDGQVTDTPTETGYLAIASNHTHNLAIKFDGSLITWGYNPIFMMFPPSGNDYVAIAAGYLHNLALRNNGSIVAWGINDPLNQDDYGQVRDTPTGSDFIAVAAGVFHSLALKADGSIVGWGSNMAGQIDCPSGNDYVAIAAGTHHSLALKDDGSIVGWGHNDDGQVNCPTDNYYTAIAGGSTHSLALGNIPAPKAKIIFVDRDTPLGSPKNGSSWLQAFKYLQDGLRVASSGDEIRVAQGIYKPDCNSANPNGSSDRMATFQLRSGVTIKGGYAGWGEPEPGVRNIKVYKTILSGDIGTPDVDTDNSYHVVTGSGTDDTAVLDGLIITAGNANGPTYYDKRGGGIYNHDGSPTVINCIFIKNSAGAGAGMLNDYECSPTIINCAFIGNSAEQDGGGVHNYGLYSQNKQTLINCTFNGNTAGIGGGISNWDGSTPTLTNCILWGNSDSGGYDESAQISECNSITTINYSLVQGWTGSLGGTGNIGDDPLFKDVDGSDNILGTEDDDLRLSGGSPCIDAGDNSALPLDITTDLAGTPRKAGWNVDLGAYEFDDRPVAHWKLDEIRGDISYDSSGNGNHGSLYGDPNWQLAGGKIAGALEFDGVDDYVLENGGLNLNGLDGLTIALWIRSDVTGTDKGFIHFEDPHGTDDRGMRYDAFGATGGGVSGIKVGVTSDSPDGPPGWPGRQQLESSSNVQTTDWQHLAMTWSSGEQLKLYINGVLDTPTANEPALSGVLFGYNMVLIGRGGKYGQPGTDAMGWDGLIDDVRIYNYALSGDDIRWLLCDKPPIGDVNGDCRFDFVDLAILLSEWLDCGMMVPELCW
ncbi:MAG: hypothetical protein GWN67_04190 [Phycisphaerae bacterium]|nr:hypothetical protein [Gammaproteobacteria bacterium]NIQ75394.1 hypothetical protein [Gammaproteobacteria bacterium]NIS50333.1 hypothetical protein [Phycisphaerae bacterium]NIU55610.1 hypothetical protein [Phycisphaerae bacterium]NIW92071.1 hypothetical protein [Phycisphaerae bacterium]